MKFRVKALRRAEADIRQISNYIFTHSPQGADAWLNAYKEAVDRLSESATSYSAAYENDHFEIEVKQTLFKTKHGRVYRLLFTIVGHEVRFLRVRGPGQAVIDPKET